MQVTDIYQRGGNNDTEYTVRYAGALGDGRFSVYATDELNAFKRATEILKEREVNERIFIIAATISLLGLFSLTAYACTTPSFRETCIAAGKAYIDTSIQSADKPDIEACI